MSILHNADRAIVDQGKVRDYLLNPLHGRGGHKARMFRAALGFERIDHLDLIAQIRSGILTAAAERMEPTRYGERFRVDVLAEGPRGSAVVRTLWIYRKDEDVPRFTSAYPLR